jgi:hypothetical protein
MELFTATGKLIFSYSWRCSMCPPRVTRHTSIRSPLVWQELEYRIGVCRVTRDAHLEHL